MVLVSERVGGLVRSGLDACRAQSYQGTKSDHLDGAWRERKRGGRIRESAKRHGARDREKRQRNSGKKLLAPQLLEYHFIRRLADRAKTGFSGRASRRQRTHSSGMTMHVLARIRASGLDADWIWPGKHRQGRGLRIWARRIEFLQQGKPCLVEKVLPLIFCPAALFAPIARIEGRFSGVAGNCASRVWKEFCRRKPCKAEISAKF